MARPIYSIFYASIAIVIVSCAHSPKESEDKVLQYRLTPATEPVVATIDPSKVSDLKSFDGQIVAVRGTVERRKEATGFFAKDVIVQVPSSADPGGEPVWNSEVIGRLKAVSGRYYFTSPNDHLEPGQTPFQSRASGWIPATYELLP